MKTRRLNLFNKAMQILPHISRSKGNQTLKFGQLIEHKIRTIFLKKPYTEYDAKTIPRPIFEKSKLGSTV